MADEKPEKHPLGASAAQALTPQQEQLLEDFQDALARVKEQAGVKTDAELCAVIDKLFPWAAPN